MGKVGSRRIAAHRAGGIASSQEAPGQKMVGNPTQMEVLRIHQTLAESLAWNYSFVRAILSKQKI